MADTNIIINIFLNEAEKGNLHEVVLFLRVDAVKTKKNETRFFFGLAPNRPNRFACFLIYH